MIPRYRVWHHELGRLMSVKCMFFHDSEIEEFELNDALMNDYIRLSERESGHGRADLILEPKKKENPGYIFEFKVANSEEELESYAEEGFEQIKEKKYDTELINRGVTEITYIGLAFYKKKLKMKYEKI